MPYVGCGGECEEYTTIKQTIK